MADDARPLEDLLHPSWAEALKPVEADIRRMGDFLRKEQRAKRRFLPAGDRVFAAFASALDTTRVLIVGQDPYPTPGHAIGLSFAVAGVVTPVPRSLNNIFREYEDDLGLPPPANGDLTPWVGQGVLLLNRCLTVRPRSPGSHRGKGWEVITDAAIDALVARHAAGAPLVAVLWGRDAQSLTQRLADVPIVASSHPSPMSADRGFFGSRPFSRVNELLSQQGAAAVDWRLPGAAEVSTPSP
ncbi:MAG: uracil-DNA glycosylase [Nitriliruptoraceae bacterium]